MVFVFCLSKIDFGKMRKDEEVANLTGDLNAGETELASDDMAISVKNNNPKVRHLLIPVITLILCCIGGMIYTGYCYDWESGLLGPATQSANIIEAFSNCDAGLSLAIGSTIALIITIIYYLISKAVSFNEIMESISQGFKAMVPAILILAFAWVLSGVMGAKGGYLDAQAFVQNTLSGVNLGWLFPALFFTLACLISFATGTSWGTFGVLIPIATAILGSSLSTVTLLTVSATLGGAVFGDHISPISDTTILASTGANCNHLNHVRTQAPYAILIALITFVVYLVGGLISNLSLALCALILLALAAVLFSGTCIVLRLFLRKNNENIVNATN